MKARDALKRATRDVHDRLDAILSSYRLDDAADYRRFLTAQAAAFLPVERALTAAGAGDLVPGWTNTLRGSLLIADLDALGARTPREVAPPAYDNEAALLGGIYVLEGSRMGAAVLSRQVPAHLPRRFLATRSPPGHWAAILGTLERKLTSSVELNIATAAAQRTFACFESSGRIDQIS